MEPDQAKMSFSFAGPAEHPSSRRLSSGPRGRRGRQKASARPCETIPHCGISIHCFESRRAPRGSTSVPVSQQTISEMLPSGQLSTALHTFASRFCAISLQGDDLTWLERIRLEAIWQTTSNMQAYQNTTRGWVKSFAQQLRVAYNEENRRRLASDGCSVVLR